MTDAAIVQLPSPLRERILCDGLADVVTDEAEKLLVAENVAALLADQL